MLNLHHLVYDSYCVLLQFSLSQEVCHFFSHSNSNNLLYCFVLSWDSLSIFQIYFLVLVLKGILLAEDCSVTLNIHHIIVAVG